jgi:hypothetical protein
MFNQIIGGFSDDGANVQLRLVNRKQKKWPTANGEWRMAHEKNLTRIVQSVLSYSLHIFENLTFPDFS